MTLPVTLFSWLMSTIPILLLVFFMVFRNWSAVKAAPLTLVISIILGITIFRGSFLLIGVELLRASWSSLSIILVIITAILLYEVSNEVDAFDTLNYLFKKIAPNELIRILLIGVVFASFMQGVTGFGVPVLITAPLLVQIGVKPLWAAIIPLVGHTWAGTFGTLAIAWDALLEQIFEASEVVIQSSAYYGAIYLFILTLSANFFIAYAYGGFKALKKGFIAVFIISLIQGGGQIIVSQINPSLASFLPSALTLLGIIILSKTPLYNKNWSLDSSPIMNNDRVEETKEFKEESVQKLNMSVFESLIPYIVMTIVTLSALLINPINTFLGQFMIAPNFIRTETGYGVVNPAVENFSPLRPFTHAGMFLLIASVFAYIYYLNSGHVKTQNPIKNIWVRTLRKAKSPTIAVISLLMISRVMAGTGQTVILAEGMTNVLGQYYSLVAPFVGLLGSFITGSNMSSNILFGNFQYLTAEFIGLSTPSIIGVQTAGGAIGMAIAPGNIVLGATATNSLGSEGRILIKIIPFAIIVASIMGILAFLI